MIGFAHVVFWAIVTLGLCMVLVTLVEDHRRLVGKVKQRNELMVPWYTAVAMILLVWVTGALLYVRARRRARPKIDAAELDQRISQCQDSALKAMSSDDSDGAMMRLQLARRLLDIRYKEEARHD